MLSIALRSMVAVIAALAIALAFTFGGAPARPSEPGSRDGSLIESVFATLYSDTGEYRAAASSQIPRVRLASLETDFTTNPASAADQRQTTAAMAATDRASFEERFFGERFASFDERFGSARKGDPEPMPRSVQRPRSLPAAESDADGPAPTQAPRRQNARLAMLAPPANPTAVTQVSLGAASSKAILANLGSRTAIYDISAQAVYLPNGERLEAHSGLGSHMDDPRSVAVKNRGATPPNVYELSLRERLFHGVRAIRLTPVDRDKMFGRAGILAHSYLLGPNGQSNGCVSISDYPKFLNAFLNGEIDRLVVVERLMDAPPAKTAVGWLSERLKALFKSS